MSFSQPFKMISCHFTLICHTFPNPDNAVKGNRHQLCETFKRLCNILCEYFNSRVCICVSCSLSWEVMSRVSDFITVGHLSPVKLLYIFFQCISNSFVKSRPLEAVYLNINPIWGYLCHPEQRRRDVQSACSLCLRGPSSPQRGAGANFWSIDWMSVSVRPLSKWHWFWAKLNGFHLSRQIPCMNKVSYC